MGDDQGYNRKNIHSILFSFWNTRVSILLSARSVFIAIETVIFSVGVYLASLETRETNFLLMLVVYLLGIILAILWWWICTDFGRKERYFRWRIVQFEKDKYPFKKDKYSSGKVWSDFINFEKELKENREKKRYELFWDDEWKQIKPKWFPTKVLNNGLPCLFMIFLTIVFIISISLQGM